MSIKSSLSAFLNLLNQFILFISITLYFRNFNSEIFIFLTFFFFIYSFLSLIDLGIPSYVLKNKKMFVNSFYKFSNFIFFIKKLELMILLYGLLLYLFFILFLKNFFDSSLFNKFSSIDYFYLFFIFLNKPLINLFRNLLLSIEKINITYFTQIIFTFLKFFLILIFNKIYNLNLNFILMWFFIISVLEYLCFFFLFLRLFPEKFLFVKKINLKKEIKNFFIPVYLSGVIWLILLQLDKIFLYNKLSLKEVSYFAFIMILVNSFFSIFNGLNNYFIPKISSLLNSENKNELIDLLAYIYRDYFIFSLLILLSFYFFSFEILMLLTNDYDLSIWAKDLIIYYYLGLLFFSISLPQFYVSIASGNFNYNLIANALFLIFYFLLLLIFTNNKYIILIPIIWSIMRLIIFVFLTSHVLSKFNLLKFNFLILKILLPSTIVVTSFYFMFYFLNFITFSINNFPLIILTFFKLIVVFIFIYISNRFVLKFIND